jgi:hypothetical protein
MKRHVFNLAVPDSIYAVIKEHKKHRLPTKSFFLEIFLNEIDRICEGDPDRVAKLLRQMFLDGLRIEVTEEKIKLSLPLSGGTKREEKKEGKKKEMQDVKDKVKKIEKMYDLS